MRVLLMSVCVLTLAVERGLAEQPTHEVVSWCEDGRVSVHAHRVPRGDVVRAIARSSGATLRGEPKDDGPVVTNFERVPIVEGLVRVLGDQDFALVYRKNGTLGEIRLYGGPPAPAPSLSSEARDLLELIDRHPQIPISGKVGEVLGRPSASLRELLGIAMENADAATREDAMRIFLGTIDDDADIVSAVTSVDEDVWAEWVQSTAGDRARSFLAQVATLARSAPLRTRAANLLFRYVDVAR